MGTAQDTTSGTGQAGEPGELNPTTPRQQTQLEAAGERRLLFGVAAQTRGRKFVDIVGRVDDETVVAWGFYGGLLTAAAGLAGLSYNGFIGLWNVWPTFAFSLALVVGLLLIRFGRRTTMETRDIARVDLVDRVITLLGDGERTIALDDVTEVVFGLSRYPVSGERNAVKVQAASVLVRLHDERLVTIVGACTAKDAAYGVARFIGSLTGHPVKQVGEGVK